MVMILYARSTARIRCGYTLSHCRCCGQTQPFLAYKYRTTRLILFIPMWQTTGVYYGKCDVCGEDIEWAQEAVTTRRWHRHKGVSDLAGRIGADTSTFILNSPIGDRSVRGMIERAEEDPDAEGGMPKLVAIPYLLACAVITSVAVALRRMDILNYADEFGVGFTVGFASLIIMYFVTRAIWRSDRRRNHARRMVRRVFTKYAEAGKEWLRAAPDSSDGEILRDAVRIALGLVVPRR